MPGAALPQRSIRIPASAPVGGSVGQGLPCQVEPQLQGQWCWAAVSATVARYFDLASTWTQCQVAQAELGGQCCANGSSARCNRAYYLDKALKRVGHFAKLLAGALSRTDLARELNAGRPIAIRVQWRAGGGHFLIVRGLVTGEAEDVLMLSDPIYGDSLPQRSVLLRGGYQTGGGRWTHSYTLRP